MNDFERQLKKLLKQLAEKNNIQPSQQWLSSTRQQLKQAIKQSGARPTQVVRRTSIFTMLTIKPLVATVAIVLIVLLAGGGTVMAAQNSDPGDTLYSVKLAGEKLNLIIALSPQAKARLHMRYADRRLGELERIYLKHSVTPSRGMAVLELSSEALNVADTQDGLSSAASPWEEILVQRIGASMAGTKEQMEGMLDSPEYADIALRFEEITQQHRERMDAIRQKLNTSTAIILDRARRINDQNHDHAIDTLKRAEKMLESQEKRLDSIHDRLQKRFEYLENRHQELNLDLIDLEADSSIIPIEVLEDTRESDEDDVDNKGVNYEIYVDDDGIHFESEIEIESEGSENIDTYIELNDGQVIIDSIIQATGTTIIINESSTLDARSDTTIRINGDEIEIE